MGEKISAFWQKVKSVLPSRRFSNTILVIMAVIVLALALLLLASSIGGKIKAKKLEYLTVKKQTLDNLKNQLEKDTDKDGLPDWEEVLWKTDLNSPDTDNDGLKDGDEVTQKRNPLVAGPNDAISETSKNASSTDEYFNNPNMSATEKLSQKFFLEYMEARAAGEQMSEEKIQQIVTDSLSVIDNTGTSTAYDLSKIKVGVSQTPKDMRDYGNALGVIAKKYAGEHSPGTEMAYFQKATENKNKEALNDLLEVAGNYGAFAKDIMGITAPKNASEIHLNIINAATRTKNDIIGMTKLFDDAVIAAVALNSYMNDTQMFANAISELQNYFITNKIVFSPEEPGYYLMPK